MQPLTRYAVLVIVLALLPTAGAPAGATPMDAAGHRADSAVLDAPGLPGAATSVTTALASKQRHLAQSAGLTTRVSVASDGTQANGRSTQPSISADGRFIAFVSEASNLTPGDTNGVADIFVHDRQTGQTTRVSVASDGTQANGPSEKPSISADGRFVAFESTASNLVPGTTSRCGFLFFRSPCAHIYVHDRQTGQTTRVSVASDGTQATRASGEPSISADGRFVAFHSDASNLAPGANGSIFIHDRQTGETTRVPMTTDGAWTRSTETSASISADGRFAVFDSSVAWNRNVCGARPRGLFCFDVFVHDRQRGETRRISIASDGAEVDGDSVEPSISANGRFVVIASKASNLAPGDTNQSWDIFVHDLQTGRTTRVSVASDGTEGDNSSWWKAPISADGRFVAFESGATNLVPGDTNRKVDIFVHDQRTGQTTRVSIASDGSQSNGSSEWASISADGRFVAFVSSASNLVPGDTNERQDIFVHDRQAARAR